MSFTGPLAYAAVYVAAILEGEVVFVAAAVLVAAGKLNALAVMAFGALGAATGDQLFFYAFRGRIAGWLTRSRAVAARHESIVSRVQRHQSLMILAIRFAPGLRIAITAACAYGNVSPVRFSALNLVSAFAWSFVLLDPGLARWPASVALRRHSRRLGGYRSRRAVDSVRIVALTRSESLITNP